MMKAIQAISYNRRVIAPGELIPANMPSELVADLEKRKLIERIERKQTIQPVKSEVKTEAKDDKE